MPNALQWPRQMPIVQSVSGYDFRTQLSVFADELALSGLRRIGYIAVSAGNEWCFELRLGDPAGF